VHAEHFSISKNPPASFEEIKKVVTEDIPKDLKKAQCGGWDTDQSVVGKIPVVTGVPGRDADPLGNIRSGMAKRNDNFIFPDEPTTKGLATACQPNVGNKDDPASQTIKVLQWTGFGPAENKREIEVPHPYFEDPPCVWRAGGEKLQPPLNEAKCREFCEFVNSPLFTFWDCRVSAPILDDAGNVVGTQCIQDGQKYTCTQDWIDLPFDGGDPNNSVDANLAGIIPQLKQFCDPNAPHPAAGLSNARSCRGEACRTVEGNNAPYMSYYRSYEASYRRDPVITDKNTDIASNNAQVACYGLYREFDPKTKVMEKEDQRCVIQMDVSQYPKSQQGKGDTKSDLADPDPSGPILRDPTFKESEDLWYQNLGGGMSFLNDKVFSEEFAKDLSTALLTADEAKQRAAQPFVDPKKTVADAALVRAFDDTVSNERGDKRTVTEWWQRLETDANRIFTRPVVRLFLPPAWSFGIDALDPILVQNANSPEGSDPAAVIRSDPRMLSIEAQLNAKEDTLGQVAKLLERNLLFTTQEEIIPFVYPLGSVTEFRAVKQAWITWRAIQKGADGSAPFPGEDEVNALIEKLEQYAIQAEGVRTLRAELPRYIGQLTARQQEIAAEIAAWEEKNLTAYRDYLVGLKQMDELRSTWRTLQQKYIDFHDKTNMPWCKNDRFTTSIYSLVSLWLPQREGQQGLDLDSDDVGSCEAQDGLPRFCVPENEKDLVFDFTHMEFTRAKTPVKIPVLKPTLVRLQLPLPPGHTETIQDPKALELPDFPPVPSIFAALSQQPFPQIKKPINAPDIIEVNRLLPSEPRMEQWKDVLTRATTVITNMNEAYKQFWDSIQMFDPAWREREKMPEPTCDTEDGPVPMQPLDCCGFGKVHCVHPEPDLLERIKRIGDRPAVLVKEDFQARGDPRKLPECDPKDHVCQTVLPEERSQVQGWQVQMPKESPDAETMIEKLRTNLREQTLTPAAEIRGNIPYEESATELYPVFDVPRAFDLRPPVKSSSSSSTQ